MASDVGLMDERCVPLRRQLYAFSFQMLSGRNWPAAEIPRGLIRSFYEISDSGYQPDNRLLQATSHRQRRFAGPKQRELLGYRFPAGDAGSIAIERKRADTLGNVDRGIVAVLALDK